VATRLYFTNSTAPYSPATLGRGTYNRTTGAVTKLLGSAPGGTATTVSATKPTTTPNPYNTLAGRWVSAPLSAGTLAGVVSWVIGSVENTTSANAVPRIHIFVTAGDSDTVRGTVLSNYTGTLATQEFPTTAAGQSALDQTLTSLAVQAGDRLVVEVGTQFQNSISTATSAFNYGGSSSVDMYKGDTGVTGLNGWVQFSDPNQVIAALPAGDHNLATNPAAGNSTTAGWFAAASSGTPTVAASAVSGMSRSTGVKTTINTTSFARVSTPQVPAAVGEIWSFYVECSESGSDAVSVYFNFYDAGGAFLNNLSTSMTLTSAVQTASSWNAVAPANTAFVGIDVEPATTWAAGTIVYVSCVRYEQSAVQIGYADGDSSGWVWDGTSELSTSHQPIADVIITGDTPSGQRSGGPDGLFVADVILTGDSPAAARQAGGDGSVAVAFTDSPAAQRCSGPDGALAITTVLTDTPGALRAGRPDGVVAIGVAQTDSPAAGRLGGPDGSADIGVTFGPDSPAALRAGGPDGLAAPDLTLTDRARGARCGGPSGSVALGVALTDGPMALRASGPDGSVLAALPGAFDITGDTPSALRSSGPDGLLALGLLLAGDSPAAGRAGGPDGLLALDVVLTDTTSAARNAGPDGLLIALLSDTPSALRCGTPDGSMGIDLPLAGDSPAALRCGGFDGVVSIGIGADVTAGSSSPSALRCGGPNGEVLLAFLPSKPPYIPVAPTVAPYYSLWLANTRTGKMLWSLPFITSAWDSKLNDIGTIRTTLVVEDVWDALSDQDERDPRVMLREILSGPWRFSLVLKWGYGAVWAGPYINFNRQQNPRQIELNGAEIAKMFTKRVLINPAMVNGPADPTADTTFGPTATKPHVAAALVQQAMAGSGKNLPITVTDPGGSGTDARVYYGYDLAKYWDKMQALSAEVDGPELRFDPQIVTGTDGDYVNWTLQIGNPHVGRTTTPWVFDSDVNSIVTMAGDASNMAFEVYSSGSGQSRDKLIASSSDTSLLKIDWPMLEEVDSGQSSEVVYPVIAARSASVLAAYKTPLTAYPITVPADVDPMVGSYRVGEDFAIDVRNDPIVPDGFYTRRIAALSGSEKPWVTITDTDPLPVGSS
jgi:hypothetical protein